MARFAFLLYCPFLLTACAEEHYDLLSADDPVSRRILGKTEEEVTEILKSDETLAIVADYSSNRDRTHERTEIWYFDKNKHVQMSVTFVDGHAIAVASADVVLRDPKTNEKIQELQVKQTSK